MSLLPLGCELHQLRWESHSQVKPHRVTETKRTTQRSTRPHALWQSLHLISFVSHTRYFPALCHLPHRASHHLISAAGRLPAEAASPINPRRLLDRLIKPFIDRQTGTVLLLVGPPAPIVQLTSIIAPSRTTPRLIISDLHLPIATTSATDSYISLLSSLNLTPLC